MNPAVRNHFLLDSPTALSDGLTSKALNIKEKCIYSKGFKRNRNERYT